MQKSHDPYSYCLGDPDHYPRTPSYEAQQPNLEWCQSMMWKLFEILFL